ncbi:MAG: hypothetical protein IIY35_00780 [Ruminococcus sp.]|nr:hypothetical protein [Ruminococcus sp.]
MEGFQRAVKAICIASAAVCLIESLTAGTRMQKQMKFLLDLVMAVVIITPFISGTAAFEMPEVSVSRSVDTSYSLELYNRTLSRKTAQNIGDVLYSQLSAAGINCEKIDVEVNISPDGSISISKVIVIADDNDSAADIIKNCLGDDTEVINGDP